MKARDSFLWQRDGTDAAGRLGRDDVNALAFFPGMNQSAARKLAWLAGFLDEFERAFEVVPFGRHAEAREAAPHLPLGAPRFNPAPAPCAARFGPADGAAGWGDEEGVVSAGLRIIPGGCVASRKHQCRPTAYERFKV